MNTRMIFLMIMLWTIVPSISSAECGSATNVQIGSNGPGYETPAITDPDLERPDFIITSLQLKTESGIEKYEWAENETIKMHSWTDNVGDADWDYGNTTGIEGGFYLSKNYKEDSHSDWIRVGTDFSKKENLDISDDPHHEEEGLNIWEYVASGDMELGGTYNIVYCADRTADQDNGDGDVEEMHKSNNCSTEAVFVVNEVGGSISNSTPLAAEWLMPLIMTILEQRQNNKHRED